MSLGWEKWKSFLNERPEYIAKKYTLDKFSPLVELTERTSYRLYFFSRRVFVRNSTEHSVFNYNVLLLILSLLLNEKNSTVKVGAFSKRQLICFTYLLQIVLFKNYPNKIRIYYFERLVNRLYIRPTERLLPRWSVCAINVHFV